MKTGILRFVEVAFHLILVCFIVVSCQNDTDVNARKEAVADIDNSTASTVLTEQALPGTAGESVVFKMNGEEIYVKKVGDKYIWMGDIVLSKEQVEMLQSGANQRTATSDFVRHWPSSIVYYTINSGLANQQRVTNAIAHWESVTSLDFQVRTNQSNYIEFVSAGADDCSSSIGQIGGRQTINLGTNCSTGNTIHEIGHAVGFYHEQSRTDRGNAIQINWANIENNENTRNQFRTYSELGRPGFQFGAFDFGSVMLYGSFAFSSNGLPTIQRINQTNFVGQRNGLSQGDIETANAIYGAPYAKVRKVQISYDSNSSGTTSYYNEEADYFVEFYNDRQCTSPYTGNAPRVVNVNKQLNQANGFGGYSSSISNLSYQRLNGESGAIWLGRYNNYENTNYGDITSGEYVNFAVTSPNKGNY